MPDTFALTIIVLIVTTLLIAFINRRSIDKCLKHFSGYPVNLQQTNGNTSSGILKPHNNSMEIIYTEANTSNQGITVVLYKAEYNRIKIICRYLHSLDAKQLKKRNKVLKRSYRPSFLKRINRSIFNMFKTIRDSLVDSVNLLVSKMKAIPVADTVLSSQSKYVDQVKQQLINTVGTAYEAILEKYLGHRVIVELVDGDEVKNISGILKDYTATFIELLEATGADEAGKTMDCIIPRNIAIVRHLEKQ